jgi:hypothetical protein
LFRDFGHRRVLLALAAVIPFAIGTGCFQLTERIMRSKTQRLTRLVPENHPGIFKLNSLAI